MTKATQGGAKAATSTKAGAASSPQSTARAGKSKAYEVATGHAFHGRNGRIEAGTVVKAEHLKSKNDPTGEREFERQVKAGTLVLSSKTADDVDGQRAGGGVIDQGGATGAAPSGAQVTAATTGDDPAAAAVVDAALTGSEGDLEKANGVDTGKAPE